MQGLDANAAIDTGRDAFDRAQSDPERLLLAKFVALHCSSCVTLAPVIKELAAEYGDRLTAVAVDITEEPELAVSLKVRSAPTVILLRQDRELGRIAGLKPKKQYRELIQSNL